jgi:hypothetical protein
MTIEKARQWTDKDEEQLQFLQARKKQTSHARGNERRPSSSHRRHGNF